MLTIRFVRLTFPPVDAALHYSRRDSCPDSLCYSNYAASCEASDEPWLELTLSLAAVYEHAFAPELICRALGELNPVVQLLAVEKLDGTLRPD